MKKFTIICLKISFSFSFACNNTDCQILKNSEWVLVQLDSIPVKSISKDRAWFKKFKEKDFIFGEKDLKYNGQYTIAGDSIFFEYLISSGNSQKHRTKFEVTVNCDSLILHTDFYRLLHEKFKVRSIYIRR